MTKAKKEARRREMFSIIKKYQESVMIAQVNRTHMPPRKKLKIEVYADCPIIRHYIK